MHTTTTARFILALALAGLGCGGETTTPTPADAGSTPNDTGSVTDTGAVTDTSSVIDTGATTDSGAPADVTVARDVSAPTDAGSPADAGSPTDAATDDVAALPRFSFFVTSLRALQELSGSQNGFGGDLRYGETGPGAGLRGADRICTAIAERSMPGSGRKVWRAFLSVTNGGDGQPVHAINRIGNGPWYDRLGRLFGNGRTDILTTRPSAADPAIRNDFPNEDGVPNHRPDPTQPQVDNHDMLTGSNAQGMLYSSTGTCLDWTNAVGDRAISGRPRVGHSWPRNAGGTGMMDNWMSSLDEAGCAPGVSLIEMGPPILSMPTVGSGGGYGGFYCFALTP